MANLFFMIVINSMYVQQSSIYSNRQYTFPQFGSYKTTFSKKLEEVIAKKKVNNEDKTFLSRELNNILDGKLSKRFLGEGVDGQVYKIDDKFVMHFVSLLMKPDFINSPYKNFDLELLQSMDFIDHKNEINFCYIMAF